MSKTTLEGTRPRGRPPKHYVRWLARQLAGNGLDRRTGPAKLLKMRADELADDVGGWGNLTNREAVLVRRTAALLLLCETIERYAFTQESPFTERGELLAVLGKNYIAYSNTVRLNLLALGLRPERPGAFPTLQQYLASRSSGGRGTLSGSPASVGTAAAPASTTPGPPVAIAVATGTGDDLDTAGEDHRDAVSGD